VRVELRGLDAVITGLGKVEKDLIAKVDKELQGAALRVVGMAKMRLQPHSGDGKEITDDIVSVRQTINFTFDPVKHSVMIFAGNVSNDPIAAYLEFGTGKYAAKYVKGLPAAFVKLALTFYKNGKGTLREHPFLIPAFLQEGKRLQERLSKVKIGW